MYPKKFNDLIQAFQKLPGVGYKTAERYAFETLNWNQEDRINFIDQLDVLKDGIDTCNRCGNLSEGSLCEICKDENRNNHTICVVQSPKDIASMEQIQEYKGYYHVLYGLINMQKGIMPQDIRIAELKDRIEKEDIEEVVLALDPTVEGETTALYIEKLIGSHVKVTRLAYGIPVGSHLDYADSMTLLKAFQNRK